MASQGLDEFKQVLTDFTDIGALGLKLAVAAPFIGLTFQLGPPPIKAVTLLTALCELLVLLWIFHFWFRLEKPAHNRRMAIALFLFCVGLIGSLVLMSQFTLQPNANGQRIVKGFILQPSVAPLIGRELSSTDEALRGAQYDASEVWTQASITTVHVALIAVWLSTFASLAAFISLFVIARRNQSTEVPKS